MEETIWEILHLDIPTSNEDEIKKAYSEQSKKCNPEENPEEFQKIYNAYKIAISYARRRNSETEYQKPNIESVLENANEENSTEANSSENELLKTFENIYQMDRYEFDKIQNMIAKIDKSFGDPDELEKVVESEEFFELMRLRDFQTNLSIYLNNRPGSYNPSYVIYVAYKRFLKENPDCTSIESLKKYFDPLVRDLAGGNINGRKPNKSNSVLAIIFFIIAMALWFAASTISDDTPSSYIEKELSTDINEVLTYEYDEDAKAIVSNDRDFSIKYNIPEGFSLAKDYFNSDYGKYYQNDQNIKFGIATDPCGVEEYYKIWNEEAVGKLNKTNIKGKEFYYIKFPNMVDSVQNGFNLIFWTEISDKDVLIIDTKSDIEINQFISLIEKILPLTINTYDK